MSNVYVVPLSFIATINEQKTLEAFETLEALTRWSVLWNGAALSSLIDKFRLGSFSSSDFRKKCISLFPSLSNISEEDFISSWQQMCMFHDTVETRLQQLAELQGAGHEVLIVGNVDVLLFDWISTQLRRYDYEFPRAGFSFTQGDRSEQSVRTLLQKNKAIYYIPPPPILQPYSNLPFLRWLIAPLECLLAQRAQAEQDSILYACQGAGQLIPIMVSDNGEIQGRADDRQEMTESTGYFNMHRMLRSISPALGLSAPSKGVETESSYHRTPPFM